jgi:tRNA pseudouridine32 synthase/23S rRNA pseudouridine746 synthase
MTGEEIVARVLYRDALMLVIDKPAGFAVHKGPRGGESLEDFFGALRFGLPRAPALAHRLDRDTSGCLVLGRHRKALAELGRLFKAGRIDKTYWAVVAGGPREEEGRIELPLGRKDATRGWWMKHDPMGQPAVTTWKLLGRAAAAIDPELATSGDRGSGTAGATGSSPPPPNSGLPEFGDFMSGRSRIYPTSAGEGSGVGVAVGGHISRHNYDPPPPPSATRGEGVHRASSESGDPSRDSDDTTQHLTWLALEPLTGRTHQLRVHCAAMGWPIVGDSVYGNAPRAGGPGLHLHAREIAVPLYKNRAPIRVVAPVPAHMQAALRACGWTGEAPPGAAQ